MTVASIKLKVAVFFTDNGRNWAVFYYVRR